MNKPARGAAEVVAALRARAQTLAVVESVTGGLLAATIVGVPGASAVFRGGLVVYATDLKRSLAGVPAELLAERGPVDPEVVVALAEGGRVRCGAHWALATTGVAGPEQQDGKPVGLAYVGLVGPDGAGVRRFRLPGDRAAVRSAVVRAALFMLADNLIAAAPGAPSDSTGASTTEEKMS